MEEKLPNLFILYQAPLPSDPKQADTVINKRKELSSTIRHRWDRIDKDQIGIHQDTAIIHRYMWELAMMLGLASMEGMNHSGRVEKNNHS